ncbi:MAG: hypothetical protein QM784_28240 [Polyangiaceae bacterium]
MGWDDVSGLASIPAKRFFDFTSRFARRLGSMHTSALVMTSKHLGVACLCCLFVACTQPRKTEQSRQNEGISAPSASVREARDATQSATPPTAARLPEPMRIAELPVSAYQATLAMDDEAVFLLTQTAAYRIVPGQAPQGLKLDLGIGAVLTPSAFVYWSKGAIWRTPKEGGDARKLAKFPHQPQYFVAHGERFAWIDFGDSNLYTIQTLEGSEPRILTSSQTELAALNLIGDTVYFVQQTNGGWRPGSVRLSGGDPTYGPERKGRRPSMFTGSDATYFYDIDKNDIRRLSPDVQKEESLLEQFICSPLHASRHVYCACVEGLYVVSTDTRKPTILAGKQVGPISYVTSNDKWVAWLVDAGSEKLAVNLLPAFGTKANAGK